MAFHICLTLGIVFFIQLSTWIGESTEHRPPWSFLYFAKSKVKYFVDSLISSGEEMASVSVMLMVQAVAKFNECSTVASANESVSGMITTNYSWSNLTRLRVMHWLWTMVSSSWILAFDSPNCRLAFRISIILMNFSIMNIWFYCTHFFASSLSSINVMRYVISRSGWKNGG